MTDNSVIHEHCNSLAHLVDLFCFNGRPFNTIKDPNHKVSILVNHGYVVGFSHLRKQPLWAAYRVADWNRHVDYDRPQLFYEDSRLGKEDRVDPTPFGKIEDPASPGVTIGLNRGHLVPNEAINQQFGRLAQMETFLMTNVTPQYSQMNQGIWRDLEYRILNDYAPTRDHVWVIVGPVFNERPLIVKRKDELMIPVPESYFCLIFDPMCYPYDRMSNVETMALIIPQTAGREQLSRDHIRSIDEIEQRTGLDFLTSAPDRAEAKAEARLAVDIWAPRPIRRSKALD